MLDDNANVGLEALWQHVEEHFTKPQAHDAFLAACDEAKNLAFAAQRYRQRNAASPAESEISRRQLDKITILALAQLDASKTPREQKSRTLIVAASLVSFSLLAACLYLMSR